MHQTNPQNILTLTLRALAFAVACLLLIAHPIQGQESILDLDIGQEEEVPTGPATSGESPLEEEEPPLLERPVIGTGGGRLDDLLPGSSAAAAGIEAEQVCDIVHASFGDSGRQQRLQNVKLLAEYHVPPFEPGRRYEFLGYTSNGKSTLKMTALGRFMRDIDYYEDRMLTRAAEQLNLETEQLRSDRYQVRLVDKELFDKSSVAIALLTTALSEHDSAVERRIRQGNSWATVRERLFQALFNVQLAQIRYLLNDNQTQMAIAACDRLMQQLPKADPNRKYLGVLYEQVFLAPADRAIDADNYALARDLLESYHTRYPFSQNEHMYKVQQRLAAVARKVAERGVATNDVRLLDQAAEIWPRLTGLDSMRREMVEDYPVLRCAYSTLPRRFSPLSASTASERHAVSLMFERLVRWRNSDTTGAHYMPELAATYPAPLARGRRFELPRCVWSDSAADRPRYCTVEDVLWSMKLMKRVHPAGFSPAWESLVADVDLTQTTNPFEAAVMLHRDHWQPLSLMDFPIVPKRSFPTCGENPLEIEAFNSRPVGTGPFMLAEEQKPVEVRLIANPQYRKEGLPHVREVVFHELEALDAHSNFLRGYIHLIHDVQRDQVVQLRGQGKRVDKIPARSVHFLAPNYRNPNLQNRELRLAIAHAIDRESILSTFFRPGGGGADHAALSGPYPAGSWADSPRAQEFDSSQAGAFLARAKSQINLRPLKMIYPGRNQQTSRVCVEIQQQLKAAGIEVELSAVDPSSFQQVVTENHGFDLAYWRHDFEDETYWIWPLFDPNDRGPGGSNFMGIVPDDTLSDLFHEIMIHKQFSKIQRLTHETHEYISREAVIVPLWQIDTYVAVSEQLEGVRFDPLYFFENVEQWKLTP